MEEILYQIRELIPAHEKGDNEVAPSLLFDNRKDAERVLKVLEDVNVDFNVYKIKEFTKENGKWVERKI